WLGLALDLERILGGNKETPTALVLDGDDLDPVPYPRASFHWSDEADALETVVECLFDTRWPDQQFEGGVRDQRKCKITVRYRCAEGAFAFGPFHIDVDPLMIARASCEHVDRCLVQCDPA